jgi:hypothetical protein
VSHFLLPHWGISTFFINVCSLFDSAFRRILPPLFLRLVGQRSKIGCTPGNLSDFFGIAVLTVSGQRSTKILTIGNSVERAFLARFANLSCDKTRVDPYDSSGSSYRDTSYPEIAV